MRSRRLFFVSLAAFAVIYLYYGLKRLTLGIDFTDEGAAVAWPLRLLFGERPFSEELLTLVRPLSAYLYLGFKMHPAITLYELRMLGWVLHLLSFGVLAVYLFRLSGAALQSLLVASLPFFVCHILGLAAPSYNSLSSDFLLLALALRGLAPDGSVRRQMWLNLASGLALFVATLAHPGLGLVGAGFVVYEILQCGLLKNILRRRFIPSNVGVVVFICSWLAFVIYLAATGALAVWYDRIRLFHAFTVRSVRTDPFHFYLSLLSYPFRFDHLALFFSGAALVVGIAMWFSARSVHHDRANVAAAALALLLIAAPICVFSYDPENLPICLAQTTLILLGLHWLGITAPLFPLAPPIRFLLAMALFGAVVCATVSFYFSPFRSWLSGILAFPFAFATGLTLLLGANPGRFRPLFRTLATAMLLLAVACVAHQHYRSIYRDCPPDELVAEFHTPKLRHIHSTEERVRAVDALYEYLHPKLQRGEPLVVYDHCPMLYFLFDAKPAYGMAFAVRYTQSSAALERLNQEFVAKPLPRYAIRLVVNVSNPVWQGAPAINYDNYPLNETILRRYELERTIFPFEIWRLKSADGNGHGA